MTPEHLDELLLQAETAEQQGRYDEAEHQVLDILATLGRPSTGAEESLNLSRLRVRAVSLLGGIAWRRADYTKAFEYFVEALQRSEELKDSDRIAKVLGNIGLVHEKLSDYPKALEYFNKSLNLAEDVGNKTVMANSLGSIGLVYEKLSDYSKALEYNSRSLSMAEELGNKTIIANNLGNIGIVYVRLADYPKALEYLNKSLNMAEELGNKAVIANNLSTIGAVHADLSDYPKALEYYGRSLSINEEMDNNASIAVNLGNIGSVHQRLSDYPKALEYCGKALSMDEELGNKAGVARHLANIGIVYRNLSDYPKALEYMTKALSMDEELGNKAGVALNLGNIGNVYVELSDYLKALEYYGKGLSIDEELGNRAGVARHLGNVGNVYMNLRDYAKALEYLERALHMHEELGQKSDGGRILGSLGQLYVSHDNPNRDEAKSEVYLLESIAIIQELGTKKYEEHKVLAELYERQGRLTEAIDQLKKYYTLKEEVQNEEAKKSATLMEQKKQIAEREKEIAITKAAADAKMSATTTLLYKVLPESVATRMIEGEEEIADYFPQVSILFADIAGFTPISADMPAIIVVRFLNYVFGEFDRIMKKHGCEKIKTIGDGYMAVCGAPVDCADHAERLAAAALEIQETISLPESIREYLPSGTKLGVRIGLHTGSVVAGVIGEERFVYDIYSDAVNTAARMESHGEENKIHCSNDFYRHLQNRFAMTKNTAADFAFEKRGEMEIKGKGMMRTYFLERV